MLTQEEIKQLVAKQAAQLVQNNMTIGIGSGSTIFWLIMELGKRVKGGLFFRAIPTSRKTAALAAQCNIPLAELNAVTNIDITIDGADEIDPQLQLIKGGGGALLQEKMVAAASRELLILADASKLVKQLGKFPLPLDVIPFGWKQVQRHIRETYHVEAILRMEDDQPFITDHGHYILDCPFQHIEHPDILTYDLNAIPGVADNGLFVNMADIALIGYPDGKMETRHR
ncbi:ribose-5-phosphate isomerase RpiA [Niastella caeni]|uniref:Ribose-5-phosphate isomerase A n=1 Tax=Niastella caeni TaxID=2569763 RepID=A0A4S8HHX8_9BACT|nr:ribose-5-phosphate isomerase RpiA [Niastella caeni]THU34121.1 ribose-5-phosphate isomerase RpiA [Niastella caeni]